MESRGGGGLLPASLPRPVPTALSLPTALSQLVPCPYWESIDGSLPSELAAGYDNVMFPMTENYRTSGRGLRVQSKTALLRRCRAHRR